GTVRLTKAPNRFGLPLPGSSNARLSLEVQVSESPVPTRPVFTVATSVSVLQSSLGDGDPPTPSNAKPSVPAWKHGASISDDPPLDTALPLSIAVHPVQPASANGLPPLPVRI